jgi:hypothetical protein
MGVDFLGKKFEKKKKGKEKRRIFPFLSTVRRDS